MNKFLALTAVVLTFTAVPALADHHGEGKKGKMFEKHDTNGDGVISKAEFLSHAEERFSKMDVNGDGEVTKEEGKAAREAKREKREERKASKGE
jgi:Ca2+-binding EF-hand superfamily protein